MTRTLKQRRERGKQLKPLKNAYELAREGKIHGELYPKNVQKPVKELKKGIRSFERRIAEHCDKITNPQNYEPKWHTLTKGHQQRQLVKWKREIKNLTEQKQIYEGILKNRNG